MAGLLGGVKDFMKMQKEVMEMQKKMKSIHVTGYSDDENVKIVVNGAQDIEEITIDDSFMDINKKKDLIRGIKEALKDTQRKIQKEMAKDMDIDKLKGMLGGS